MESGAGCAEDPRREQDPLRAEAAVAAEWPSARAAWGIVAALTLIGLIPRLIHLDNSYVGDELSTLFLVKGQSLPDVVSAVASDAEISPPLYFVLGWFFDQLGSAPALVRMPSFLAAIAVIPLAYMVGARMLSRPAGLVAAAVMALNPFVVFYSTDARAYMLAMALLLGTTLAMLIAIEGRGRRWWVIYAVLTALCMYAHYTTAFVLAAQLLWLLWAHPPARKAAIIANAGAVVLFAPWIPSMVADFQSPTIDILSYLQGDGFDVKRRAVESWAFGYPYNLPGTVPGRFWIGLGTAAIVVAALSGLWRWLRPRGWPEVNRGVVLALMLALATPVAELVILGLGGSDLFGARNLNTAAPGYALSIGALVTAAGPVIGAICCAAVLATFAYGTSRSLDPTVSTIDFKAAAHRVDADAGPDDVVLDLVSPAISPVPLTALDVYLPPGRPEYRTYLPEGPPPFLKPPPPPAPIVEDAVAAAEGGGRLFIVASSGRVSEDDGVVSITLPPAKPGRDETEVVTLSPSWRIVASHSWPGIGPIYVYELEQAGDGTG